MLLVLSITGAPILFGSSLNLIIGFGLYLLKGDDELIGWCDTVGNCNGLFAGTSFWIVDSVEDMERKGATVVDVVISADDLGTVDVVLTVVIGVVVLEVVVDGVDVSSSFNKSNHK